MGLIRAKETRRHTKAVLLFQAEVMANSPRELHDKFLRSIFSRQGVSTCTESCDDKSRFSRQYDESIH